MSVSENELVREVLLCGYPVSWDPACGQYISAPTLLPHVRTSFALALLS
jgi:hypothetical protein